MDQEEKKKIHRSKECASCERMFDCKGKPEGVDQCLMYEQRKTK